MCVRVYVFVLVYIFIYLSIYLSIFLPGSSTGYFQQGEDDMLLVFQQHQIVCFEEQHLVNAKIATPGDEVVYIITGEEGARGDVLPVHHIVLRYFPLA